MKRPMPVLALALLMAGSVSACAGSGTASGPPSSGSAGSTAPPAAPPAPVGSENATGVITGDDPRAQQVAELVEQAVPELALQSVVFGVWVGDEEVVRGAVDAPSVQPPTAIDAKVRVGQPMEAMLGTVLLQLASEGMIGMGGVGDLLRVGRSLPDPGLVR